MKKWLKYNYKLNKEYKKQQYKHFKIRKKYYKKVIKRKLVIGKKYKLKHGNYKKN